MKILEIFSEREIQIKDYFAYKSEQRALNNPSGYFYENECAILHAELAAMQFVEDCFYKEDGLQRIRSKAEEIEKLVFSQPELIEFWSFGKRLTKLKPIPRKKNNEAKQLERFWRTLKHAENVITNTIDTRGDYPFLTTLVAKRTIRLKKPHSS